MRPSRQSRVPDPVAQRRLAHHSSITLGHVMIGQNLSLTDDESCSEEIITDLGSTPFQCVHDISFAIFQVFCRD
jgi:hypothetical protein